MCQAKGDLLKIREWCLARNSIFDILRAMTPIISRPICRTLCFLSLIASVYLGRPFCSPSFADLKEKLASDALIVVGAGGTEEYFADFKMWAERWQQAFSEDVTTTQLGMDKETSGGNSNEKATSRQRILDWISSAPNSPERERWIVLIGHGTYQSQIAKFNLEGPDLSADELARAISANPARWRIIVCASSSGPFLNALSGPNRIIVTATKSGSEQNLSRFGDYLSKSIADPSADLDHDGNISVLEAFIMASGNLAKWYEDERRIASEQALLDDNGDSRGTPSNFFRGVRAVKAPSNGLKVDGPLANRVFLRKLAGVATLSADQLSKAAELEHQIDSLRAQKADFAEAIYYAQLELLLLDLADILVPALPDSTQPDLQ